MRKLFLALIAVAAVGALAGTATASAPKPPPYGFYCSKYDCFQLDKTGTKVASFQGRCTATKHPKYLFDTPPYFPIKSNGEFTYDKQNAVNTPDGGTLAKTSRVTIDGKFVSKSEAKGTYQLHKKGCTKISFDAKLSQGG
jgi:hypothetical protein